MGSASYWMEICLNRSEALPIDLGKNTSSINRFSDVISFGNQRWCREMSAVFSKSPLEMLIFLILIKRKALIVFQMA